MQKKYAHFLLFFLLTGIAGPLMAFEEPAFEIIRDYGDFQLRQYESSMIAETFVEGDLEKSPNSAFSILFKYISGANTTETKISMTIPVSQENADARGEKIKMTVPVTRNLTESGRYSLAFFLPAKFTAETAPKPTDPGVNLRQIPPRTMAVIRYSGNWKEKNYRKHENLLLEAIEREGLKILADPVYARYNPPFWPNFLNRNEILIEVERP